MEDPGGNGGTRDPGEVAGMTSHGRAEGMSCHSWEARVEAGELGGTNADGGARRLGGTSRGGMAGELSGQENPVDQEIPVEKERSRESIAGCGDV